MYYKSENVRSTSSFPCPYPTLPCGFVVFALTLFNAFWPESLVKQDKKILGRLSLGQCNSIGPADPLQVRRENCFKLGFSGRTYIIGAENGEDRDDWMEKLEECVPETAQRGAPAVNEVRTTSPCARARPSGPSSHTLMLPDPPSRPSASTFAARRGGR